MSPGSMLFPAGAGALNDAPLLWTLLVGGMVLFAGTLALLGWALWMPRRRVLSPRVWIVGGGLLLPIAVLGALQLSNLRRLDFEAGAMPAGALQVSLTARLWWWELRYTDPVSGTEVPVANELHLPVGRVVRLSLSGDDVIHSVWIPALAGKVDVIPGRVQHLLLQALAPGRWEGPCAEFCGEAHSRMVLQVVAEPPAAFDAWLARQAGPARLPTSALQQRGRQAFEQLHCGACHTVRGVSSAVAPGPDLTHLASRRTLGAGTLPNHAAGLRAWIAGVQRVKPGARMPSFDQLDAPTLDALVAWLGQLE